MASTTAIRTILPGLAAVLSSQAVAAGTGLNTRDQNPMLQAYYLPSIDIQQDSGWYLRHSLFITNTFQKEDTANESLLIDVENYRYDLSLAYQAEHWRISATLPFIANDGGSLDGLIEDWHDTFNLPQGGRVTNPDDQISLSYSRNGQTIFEQTRSDSNIGDLGLSFNYRLTKAENASTELGIGIELPTGSIESNSGNESTDIALWLNKSGQLSEQITFYGLIGLSLPGKGGQLKDHLKERIWLAQIGSEYDFTANMTGVMQIDLHTATLNDTELKAFDNSVQLQLALQFKNWFNNYHVDLFFSEDIMVKSAPDITFGLRLSRINFE
ncbi:MAG: DUF3187 family protein [Gammaproteobacteria bacterium]|nr:DUF3187 family protein [Gammaproteobacteria bacterium]